MVVVSIRQACDNRLAMLTLQPNLDQLERHNDESLGGTSRCTSQDRKTLGHLGDTEQVPVDLAPLVIGSELGSTLGSLHENGSRDTAVETRSTAPVSTQCPNIHILQVSIPFVLHNLLNAVQHASVVVLARDGHIALNLTARIVSIGDSTLSRTSTMLTRES